MKKYMIYSTYHSDQIRDIYKLPIKSSITHKPLPLFRVRNVWKIRYLRACWWICGSCVIQFWWSDVNQILNCLHAPQYTNPFPFLCEKYVKDNILMCVLMNMWIMRNSVLVKGRESDLKLSTCTTIHKPLPFFCVWEMCER